MNWYGSGWGGFGDHRKVIRVVGRGLCGRVRGYHADFDARFMMPVATIFNVWGIILIWMKAGIGWTVSLKLYIL